MPRIVQRQVHRNNAPAPTPEDYYRINLTKDFLNHALVHLDSRFEDDVFVCYKGFSVIPSILLATDPIWKDNVREFCNHYRQDIPMLIMQVYQQSFCCGKECGRGKRIEEKTSLTVYMPPWNKLTRMLM